MRKKSGNMADQLLDKVRDVLEGPIVRYPYVLLALI